LSGSVTLIAHHVGVSGDAHDVAST
jgi:hypothetical protein